MGNINGKITEKNAKFTPAEVMEIRARLGKHPMDPTRTTVRQEADRYGVGLETIARIRRGDTYRDVGTARWEPGFEGAPAMAAYSVTKETIETSQAKVMANLGITKSSLGEGEVLAPRPERDPHAEALDFFMKKKPLGETVPVPEKALVPSTLLTPVDDSHDGDMLE